MSYKTYEEYKNSNVEWIGDIPTHWQTNRFKIVFSYSKGKNPQTFSDEPKKGFAPYLSMEYLRNDIAPTYVPIKECPLKASNGDILLLWDGSNAGEFVVSKEGLVSSTMAKLKPNMLIYNNFSKYVCKAFEPLLRELTIGMGVPHVSSLELNNILLPKIPFKEQQQIANYLDKKTSILDASITKNVELIELLEEKRVSLINQMVTKGLDPEVPMKDSGIDWIDKIPEHWDVHKIKNLIFFQEGPGLRNWQFTDEGIRVICVTNITEKGIDFSKYEKFISEEEYNQIYKHFTVNTGDLLLSSSGNSWGKVAEYTDDETVILNTSTIRINKNPSSDYELKQPFIKWALQSDYIREQLGLMMTGSCQPNFGPTHLAKVLIALPTPKEQDKIANILNNKINKINETISKIHENIQLLEEYKTSLIHHCVTGKIDIRDEEI